MVLQKQLVPMRAKVGKISDLNKNDFIFEPKLDGIRALCYVNEKIRLISRNGNDITGDYSELSFRDKINAQSCILDGEIVAYDEVGHPDFSLLQRGAPTNYVVFDILMKNGDNLTEVPLLERKNVLKETVTDGEIIEKIFFTFNGPALWNEMKKRDLEGVMAKKTNGLYYSDTRSDVWLKIKLFNTVDCLIIGFTTGRREISSLALGLYDNEKNLVYIGKVGTGFKEKFLEELLQKLNLIKIPEKLAINETPTDIIWTKPELVCEIKYAEFTKANVLRNPSFMRLRSDKNPSECNFDQ
jgi:bifunctional non-homologous end joining protein LigD